MAKVTEVPAVPVPPPEPPRPQGVVIELTWDEFLLLRTAVGSTNTSDNRVRVGNHAYSYSSSSKRPISHLHLSEAEPEADLSDIYDRLNKVYLGG